MDTVALVENRIEDGQRLIRRLGSEQFRISVAFWAKPCGDGLWQLWIASPAVDANHMGDALHKVYAALGELPGDGITPLDLKLVANYSPIARAAIALRDRSPSRKPIHLHSIRLNNLELDEAWIYPLQLPWEMREREGHWEVLISEYDNWLSCDSEDDARAIAATPVLKDEALAQERRDPQFVSELERTADALARYRLGFDSRFLRRYAEKLRQ
jgi:hypothetical protein